MCGERVRRAAGERPVTHAQAVEDGADGAAAAFGGFAGAEDLATVQSVNREDGGRFPPALGVQFTHDREGTAGVVFVHRFFWLGREAGEEFAGGGAGVEGTVVGEGGRIQRSGRPDRRLCSLLADIPDTSSGVTVARSQTAICDRLKTQEKLATLGCDRVTVIFTPAGGKGIEHAGARLL